MTKLQNETSSETGAQKSALPKVYRPPSREREHVEARATGGRTNLGFVGRMKIAQFLQNKITAADFERKIPAQYAEGWSDQRVLVEIKEGRAGLDPSDAERLEVRHVTYVRESLYGPTRYSKTFRPPHAIQNGTRADFDDASSKESEYSDDRTGSSEPQTVDLEEIEQALDRIETKLDAIETNLSKLESRTVAQFGTLKSLLLSIPDKK